MNPRQRRGALLLILAALGAVVVFITVVGYVGSVRAEVGVMTDVLRLKQPIRAYTAVTENDVERIQVPRKWAPQTLLTNPAELRGKVAAADLQQGAQLQQGMLVTAPVLQSGQREIAIMIDAETGVAGKVHPGMLVDIYATYQSQNAQRQTSCAARIVKAALVIQVGQLTTERDAKNAANTSQVVPITFALSAPDSLKLTREESFATKIRLALIGGASGDTDTVQLAPVCQTIPAR
jgi:pilus assembly protein CpaB